MAEKLGTLVDRLQKYQDSLDELNLEIKQIEKKKEVIEAKYKALENDIFESFDKSELDGAIGKTASIAIDRKLIGTIKDPSKLYAYIKKFDKWELLQRRLNNKVYLEITDEGRKPIPGTSTFVKISLKLKKRVV